MIDIALIQETHLDDEAPPSRYTIPGYSLVIRQDHPQYGAATYAREPAQVIDLGGSTDNNGTQRSCTKIRDTEVHNTFKPPTLKWDSPPVKVVRHPAVVMGDFNRDIKMTTRLGVTGALRQQEKSSLIFLGAKNLTVITTGIIITRIAGTPKPRQNFRKADWEAYKIDIDKTCQRIKTVPDKVKWFSQLILSSAKKPASRGFKEQYIPCWSERSQELLGEYERTQDHGTAEGLLKAIQQSRKERWTEVDENMDLRGKQSKSLTLTLALQRALHLSAQMKLLKK
ncbi:RNA-directed DNA polymerase from mobile element jockey-like [Elysia marginata]|uniref:RNA-directed DNA polymerase from mobile element jockey-like n=1 Tax=Elysia marginata TaxID=1093978 RepID=A0AAV4ELI9_9GAST|nr:RNA-directed DNA polymerase from mobile element jockey-like [Elysia marginata]